MRFRGGSKTDDSREETRVTEIGLLEDGTSVIKNRLASRERGFTLPRVNENS
jgi:hypothetical protein